MNTFYSSNKKNNMKSWYEANVGSNYNLFQPNTEARDFPKSELFLMLNQILNSSADYNVLSSKESALLANDLERTDHEIKHLSNKIQQMTTNSGITAVSQDRKLLSKLALDEGKLQIVLLILNLESGLRRKYNRYVSILTKLLQHEVSVFRESFEYRNLSENTSADSQTVNKTEPQMSAKMFDHGLSDLVKNDMFIINKMSESLLNKPRPQNNLISDPVENKNSKTNISEFERTRSYSSVASNSTEYYDVFTLQSELSNSKKLLSEYTKKIDHLSAYYKNQIKDINEKNESKVYSLQKNTHILLKYIMTNKILSDGVAPLKSIVGTLLKHSNSDMMNNIIKKYTSKKKKNFQSQTSLLNNKYKFSSISNLKTMKSPISKSSRRFMHNYSSKRNTSTHLSNLQVFKRYPKVYSSNLSNKKFKTRENFLQKIDEQKKHYCKNCKLQKSILTQKYKKKMTISSISTLTPSKHIAENMMMYPEIYNSYTQDINYSNKDLDNYLTSQKTVDLTIPLDSLKKSDINNYNKLQKYYFNSSDPIKISKNASVNSSLKYSEINKPNEKVNSIDFKNQPKSPDISSNGGSTPNSIIINPKNSIAATSQAKNLKIDTSSDNINNSSLKLLTSSADLTHYNSIRSPMTITLYKGKYTNLDDFIKTINTKSANTSSSPRNDLNINSPLVSQNNTVQHENYYNNNEVQTNAKTKINDNTIRKNYSYDYQANEKVNMQKIEDSTSSNATKKILSYSLPSDFLPNFTSSDLIANNIDYKQAIGLTKNQSIRGKDLKSIKIPLDTQPSKKKLGSFSFVASKRTSISRPQQIDIVNKLNEIYIQKPDLNGKNEQIPLNQNNTLDFLNSDDSNISEHIPIKDWAKNTQDKNCINETSHNISTGSIKIDKSNNIKENMHDNACKKIDKSNDKSKNDSSVDSEKNYNHDENQTMNITNDGNCDIINSATDDKIDAVNKIDELNDSNKILQNSIKEQINIDDSKNQTLNKYDDPLQIYTNKILSQTENPFSTIISTNSKSSRVADYLNFYQDYEEINKHKNNFSDVTKMLESSISNSKKNMDKLNSISSYNKTDELGVTKDFSHFFVNEVEFDGNNSPTDIEKYNEILNITQTNTIQTTSFSQKKVENGIGTNRKKTLGAKLLRKNTESKSKTRSSILKFGQSPEKEKPIKNNLTIQTDKILWENDVNNKPSNEPDSDEVTKDSILVKLERLSNIVSKDSSNQNTPMLPIDTFFVKNSPTTVSSTSYTKSESANFYPNKDDKPIKAQDSNMKNEYLKKNTVVTSNFKKTNEKLVIDLSYSSIDNIENIEDSNSWLFIDGSNKKLVTKQPIESPSNFDFIPILNKAFDSKFSDKLVDYTIKTTNKLNQSFLDFDYKNFPEIQKINTGDNSNEPMSNSKSFESNIQPQKSTKNSKMRNRLKKALSKVSSRSNFS
ncbi:hypothetical protein BB561_003988 [Smittium simulii]|uniref:Uncharacterized protein n=1 Tax=Smittium simulii TaxID=133385 RepID=A0A2T9YIQ9_9FUNG|nr:hypothetical protein BB561_003988 [Smittium simulii]